MLSEVCTYLRNWFDKNQPKTLGEIVIENGSLSTDCKLKQNQYFRIVGSTFNDGVYINLTNRCPNLCVFCIKTKWQMDFHGNNLNLAGNEPTAQEVLRAFRQRGMLSRGNIQRAAAGEHLVGGSTREAARILFDNILDNNCLPDQKNVVLANAAFAISVFTGNDDLLACVEEARESLESGRAKKALQKFVEINA